MNLFPLTKEYKLKFSSISLILRTDYSSVEQNNRKMHSQEVRILLLLKKYIKKPATMFIINFVVYTALDYLVQLLLDLGFGIELPKYHSYLTFMNGEAYLGDGAVFALLGCAFFYYFLHAGIVCS